ncbi:hypothetical protein [Noviherbaspirillum massiliense]|uniref:hypothetical protein n=1 Tax=Noviherbaspirillum massiliense TaxID=1465823 RepID=UPI0002FB329D|nr:hypothetical protein [Noviherbaspirillum massiliense]
MKQYWQKSAEKIDALTLRERAIIFAMVALALVVLVNTFLLDTQYRKQQQLSQRVKQEQTLVAALQAEIQNKVLHDGDDPDKQNKARLEQLKQEAVRMQLALHDMQKGLVPPDRMPALLEDILKQNGSLRLVSLKTFPPVSLSETAVEAGTEASKDDKAPKAAAKPATAAVYKHGVEIVVLGTYADLLNYLTQLEGMPWQLFWSKAALNVDEYPRSTLTLTLFTLSLDEKWLNL